MIWRLLLVIALTFFSAGRHADAAEPGWGQCSCPIAVEPKATKRYSVIKNASLCVNTAGSAPEPLCSVTVHCLDDGVSGPNCDEHPKNQTWPDYDALFVVLPILTNDHYERRRVDRPFSLDQLNSILEENRETLKTCWDSFRSFALRQRDSMPVDVTATEGIACVNTTSGWLNIVIFAGALQIDANRGVNAISFQFSPLLQ